MKRVLLLLLLITLLPALRAAEDEVVLMNPDASLIGSLAIADDSFEISSGGARSKFKMNRVKLILFDTDNNDPDWHTGQQLFYEGKYASCFDRLTPVINVINNAQEWRAMTIPFAYYYYATSAGKMGKFKTAQENFDKLIALPAFTKKHPLYAPAYGDYALICLRSNNAAAAKALIPKIAEVDANLATLLKAEVAMADGKLDEAAQSFSALAASNDVAMKAQGMMGGTRIAIAKKSYDDAIASAQAAIAGGVGNELIQSDAHYYLGCAYREKAGTGATDDDKAKLLQAASMAFMRVVAVYPASDKRFLAADGAIFCFDRLSVFAPKVEAIKTIPFSKYSSKVKAWKVAQGAN